MSCDLNNRDAMTEPSLGVLNSRRSTDLLSVRRDQPTAWRRLALDFLTFCHNMRIGAPEADLQKSRSEVLSDAWKLEFQMKKWELGLERCKTNREQQGRKRSRMDSLGEEEDLEEAARALETARGQRRAYDRCVALKRAYELEGRLEKLEEEVKTEKRIVEALEKENFHLELELGLLEKKRKAAMVCADEVRWGRWK